MAGGPPLRLDRASQTWVPHPSRPLLARGWEPLILSPRGVTILAQHPSTALRAGSALGEHVIKSPSPFRDGTSSPTTSKPVCRPTGLVPPNNAHPGLTSWATIMSPCGLRPSTTARTWLLHARADFDFNSLVSGYKLNKIN